MHALLRRSITLYAFCACLARSISGAAAESKEQCVRAYENAQTAKHEGRLLDARKELLYCAGAECPEVMHADCQRWLSEVEMSMPTVVLRVTTASGATPQSVAVSIDGAEPIVLDGRAISVDPGKHVLAFSAKDHPTVSKTFEFSEGEKLRREVILLESSEPITAHRETEPASVSRPNRRFRFTLPFSLAASTTVLGAMGATYFGLAARAHEDNLDHCSPNCSRDAVDRVKREYLLTNVSLGVAAVGLITTTLVVLLQSESASPSSSAAQIAVSTSANQVNLSLSGRF